MGKVIGKKAISKVIESVSKAVETVKDQDQNLFDPLPTAATSGNASRFPKKRYILIGDRKYRVFSHTLHKGDPKREKLIHFVNEWVESVSFRIHNPSIRQVQEMQALYTRDRGYNIMRYLDSYTLYKMKVLSEDQLQDVFEED